MVENIDIPHGDSFNKTFQLLEDDGVTPISLAGATFRFAIGTTILETTSTVSVTAPVPANGEIDVLVPYALMETLTELEYPIALEVNWADGIRETVFVGILSISEDVR